MDNKFASNLKFLRKVNKFSQSKLAEELHVSKQTISAYEKGINEPNFYTLLSISKIFSCSLDDLVFTDLENDILSSEEVTKLKKHCLSEIEKNMNDYFKSINNLIKKHNKNECDNLNYSYDLNNVNKNESNDMYKDKNDKKNTYDLDYIFKSIDNMDNYVKPKLRNMRKNQLLNLNIIDFNEIEYTEIPIISEISAGLPSLAYQDLDYNYSLKIPNDYINDNYEYFVLKVKGDSMNEIYKNKELLLIRRCSSVENGEIAVVSIDKDTATLKEYYFNSEENTVYLIPHSSFEDYKTQPYNIDEHSVDILGKVEKILKI